MNILFWVLAPVIFTWYCWGMYLAVMALLREKERLSVETKVFAYPLVAVGYVSDVVLNVVIGSVIFLEPPREFVLTKRVSRLNNLDTWRGKVARWICLHLLDPFDPKGHHCS